MGPHLIDFHKIQASLEKAKAWVKELQRQANPNIVIALVGNKTDLDSQRQVSTEEALAYANEAGLLFKEASAKSGENVMDVFTDIGKWLARGGCSCFGG